MLNYPEQITAFITANFTPSDPDRANFKRTTDGVLTFLFATFPDGCISDYDLNDILLELGYERHTWVNEHIEVTYVDEAEITTINKSLVSGWCLQSVFNLNPDIFEAPVERKPKRG